MYFIDGQVFFRVQLFKSWIASVIHPINYYPDWINILAKPICPIHWIAIYQVDSIIHLSNNWAQDNYFTFYIELENFFLNYWVCMYKYTKIKGLDSREITSLPKNKNLVDMTRVISTIAEKNCMLITRLIGRDDICNDVITLALIGRNLVHDSSVDREPRGIGGGIQIPEM